MKTRLAILALALAVTAYGTPQYAAAAAATTEEVVCPEGTLPAGTTSMRCFVINATNNSVGLLFFNGADLIGITTVAPVGASLDVIGEEIDFVLAAAEFGGWNLDDLIAAGMAITPLGPVVKGTVMAAIASDGSIVTTVYILVEATNINTGVGVSA